MKAADKENMTIPEQKKADAEWLRPGEAAKQLGVSTDTLRRWSTAGRLPFYRADGGQRRYRSADVAALIRAQAVPGKEVAVVSQAVATSFDALVGSPAASLDPIKVAEAALTLLSYRVEFDLGAVVAGDDSDVDRLLFATPVLNAELTAGERRRNVQQAALLAMLLGPDVQRSVVLRKLDQPGAELAALAEMRSAIVVGLYAQGERIGALWLASHRDSAYGASQMKAVARFAAGLGRALANALQYERVKRSHLGVLKALGSALGAKDQYSLRHSARVAGYMVLLGRELGWPTTLVDQVEEACYLYDIGKIAVSDNTLTSTTALNEREWELIKQHPALSAEIMAPLFSEDIVLAVRHHHERYGGGGYPDGLVGEEVPMLARALSVAISVSIW